MGQVLFHLPVSKRYKVFVGLVLLFYTGIVLTQIVFLITKGWQDGLHFWSVIVVPTFFLFRMHSVNRFEIREAGITSNGNFTRWEKLNAFQWKKEGDYALGFGKEAYILGLVKPGDKFPSWLEWDKFRVDQRENADKCLSQYLSETT